MAAELIAFGVGANWITKLYKKLRGIQRKRRVELNKINDSLSINPLELAKYYVEPDCQEMNPADKPVEKFMVAREKVFTKIDEFFRAKKMDEPGDKQMFFLSDAGMGKTSLLAMLKLLHLTSFWPKGTECVLKKLGETTLRELKEIPDKMKTILLLDSLDEDPTAFGRVEERLLEVLDATKSFRRVIITCRTQFFPKADKAPIESPGEIEIGGYVCPSKYLSHFTDEKVDRYLKKRFPVAFLKKGRKIEKAKELVEKMGSLRCRPMLLSYIDKLLESSLLKEEMNEYSIYKALIDSWLVREERKNKIPREELLKACELLAVGLMQQGSRSIPEKDLEFIIANMPDLEKIKSIDIKGRSLLNKNSAGDFRFSHYSIQEFLTVRRFIENSGQKVENKIQATDFMLQLLLYQCEEKYDNISVFGNFDFQGVDLRGTVFHGAEKIYKNEKGYLEADFGGGLVMVYIPAGEFTMGSNDGDSSEKPIHHVHLDGYWIGKYPLTFEQYDKYCEETGKKKPDDKSWGRGKRPVINVSWDEACNFCGWLKKKTGLNFGLPTEAQWEKAARGTDGREYPWGKVFDKNKCNSRESNLKKTSPVGNFPEGASPYGCLDMAGNVWEWCADRYDEKYYAKSPKKNPKGPDNGSIRVLRGGSCYNDADFVRCAIRSSYEPSVRNNDLGFRLCQDIK